MARAKSAPSDSTAHFGFEAKLWLAAEQAVPAPHVAAAEDFLTQFANTEGMAGFVLASGPAPAGSSNQSGDCNARSALKTPKAKPQSLPRQRDIRQKLIEADLVDCMVALLGQLNYSTQIPVGLWVFAKNKNDGKRRAVSELKLALAA